MVNRWDWGGRWGRQAGMSFVFTGGGYYTSVSLGKINKILYLLMLPMQLELATGWGVMKWCPLVIISHAGSFLHHEKVFLFLEIASWHLVFLSAYILQGDATKWWKKIKSFSQLLRRGTVMSSRCEARTTKKNPVKSAVACYLWVWIKKKKKSAACEGNIPFMAFNNSLRTVEEMRTPVTFCASQHPVQRCKVDPRRTTRANKRNTI